MKRFTLSLALLVIGFASLNPCVKAQTVPNSIALNKEIKPNLNPVQAPIRVNKVYKVAEQPKTAVTSNWYAYTSQDGKYTVLFPTKPKEETQSQNTESGKINSVTAIYENQQQNIAYLAGNITYNTKVSAGESETVLDSARDGALKNTNATLINENKITLNGHSGREFFAYISKENFYLRSKIFLDTNTSTLYTVLVVSEKADINSQETTAFLDSLAIK